MSAQSWDQYSIKAEIHRRGGTLTGIAEEAGLKNTAACRLALSGSNYAGAKAISAWLGVPFDELFPHLYRHQRARENRIRKGSAAASQNRAPRAAAARAS
ncbi:helix-turn-helix domain-containing protein [Hansschlegelia zhihuaiae]|nr:helix-turn-helix domain-containing protein [Hansschlegelia zhihuaiae]